MRVSIFSIELAFVCGFTSSLLFFYSHGRTDVIFLYLRIAAIVVVVKAWFYSVTEAFVVKFDKCTENSP